MSWDSDALRTPATAYAQTLYASRPLPNQLRSLSGQKLVPICEDEMANSFCMTSTSFNRTSIPISGKQKLLPIWKPNWQQFLQSAVFHGLADDHATANSWSGQHTTNMFALWPGDQLNFSIFIKYNYKLMRF